MKKLILALFSVYCINNITAQTNPTTQTPQDGVVTPPTIVTNKFGTEYPNTTPAWNRDGAYYSAEYMDNQTQMSRKIIYDANGNIIRTENEMGSNAYPMPIRDYYTRTYPAETSYRIWMSENKKDGKKTYYSQRNSDVLWFDENGKYISTKPVKATNPKK